MTLLLVSEKPDLLGYLQSLEIFRGHTLVQYQHPLKALDNLQELLPELILWDHEDFPRHWKICANWCENQQELEATHCIIFSETGFSEAEESKVQVFSRVQLFEYSLYDENLPTFLKAFIPQNPVQTESPASEEAPAKKLKTFDTLALLVEEPLAQIFSARVLSLQDSTLELDFTGLSFPVPEDSKVYPQARYSSSEGSGWCSLQYSHQNNAGNPCFLLLSAKAD